MPPPAHMLASPTPPPRRRNSNIVVMIMRAPVAATGWPSEQPDPLTLVMSSDRPSWRHAATGTDAKASLISARFTSATDMPTRASALGIDRIGPRPVSRGFVPVDAHDTILASGVRPCAAA